MKKYSLKRKGLTVGIILVFVSVAVFSNINISAVKASNDNDLVEVTTQTYSTTKDTLNTVQLTKQQVRDLRVLFDDLKIRLSTAASMEETQMIFNDAIVSLNRYNLLPVGMSIEQAKRVVTGRIQNQKAGPVLQNINARLFGTSDAREIHNALCYVAGNTSNTHFAKLAKRITHRLIAIMDYSSGNAPVVKIATALWVVCNQLSKIAQWMVKQNGHHAGVSIYFGNYHYYPYPNWLYPARGWLSTSGINGKQNITGSFWGQKVTSGWQPQDDWYMNHTWMGCAGFTGLITYVGPDSAYYLGSALQVNVGPDRP